MRNLILASTSSVRSTLLTRAGLAHLVMPARVDEESASRALLADGARHRDIADVLAELKARKIAEKHPSAFVLGCDQVLSFQDRKLSKPLDKDDVTAQLLALQGHTHMLFSAIVLYEDARPVWRHLAEARLTMRPLSPAFIADYVAQHWDAIRHSVGGYLIEDAGIQLFSAVDGEQTAIQGLPLPPLLGYLAGRGLIRS
ncbi:MAG: Maf family protein, partial [Paracoccaceae bacterium]